MNEKSIAADRPVLSENILIRYVNCVTSCSLPVPASIVETITGRYEGSSKRERSKISKIKSERPGRVQKISTQERGYDVGLFEGPDAQLRSEVAFYDMSA
jgi:hypothetical protein